MKRTVVDNGELLDRCTNCSDIEIPESTDVYFDKPGDHHGLFDDMGKPVFVTTKAHKAYEMKKRGLIEAGDRRNGSINFDPISYRHAKRSLERR